MAALGIALGIAAIAWVLSNALNATLAFIVVLVLRPADHFPALASMQPAKLVGLVAILSWLITKLLQGDTRVSLATHGKWMLALAVGLALSSTMSTDPAASWHLYTDVFIKMLIMYGLVVHLVNTKSQAVRLHLSLALCTVALALGAIHVRLSGLATVEGNRAGLVGLLGDPNDLALVLLIYVPLFVELALDARGIRRLFGIAMFGALLMGVLATVSRGGALGLVAALGCTLYDRGRLSARLMAAPAIAALIIGMLVLAGVNDRSSGALTPGRLDDSALGRLDMWQSGVRMVAHNPVFGVGFGQFPENYQSYARNPVHWEARDAHNSFVKAAAETGLVGFIPFMALVLLTIRTAYRSRKAEVSDDSAMERAVRRSLFPSMLGFCVTAFFLSQCWSWFLFILFAQAAVAQKIWQPVTLQSPKPRDLGTMPA
jgi:O-antigen ligase